MAGPNRAALIAKLYKVLKQHYKPVESNGHRPLLEQMLFACCLENAHYPKAEKVYEHLAGAFFDWNEVRVSTVKELAEAMRELPFPAAAASNLKSVLQTVFEATYSFELETLKKQNIGAGIKRLSKMEGASQFVVAYATQHALGGHSIPLDRGALEVLYIVGLANEAERQSGEVTGLERAIAKNKGEEFGSLLHQLSADFVANPFSPTVKALLLSVNSEAKDRLPKRGQKKPFEPLVAPEQVNPHAAVPTPPAKTDGKGAPGKHGDKSSVKKEDGKESKKGAAAKGAAPETSHKKPSQKKGSAPQGAKTGRSHGTTTSRPAARSAAQKSATKRLAKRKPR
jgi:endonuclease III